MPSTPPRPCCMYALDSLPFVRLAGKGQAVMLGEPLVDERRIAVKQIGDRPIVSESSASTSRVGSSNIACFRASSKAGKTCRFTDSCLRKSR